MATLVTFSVSHTVLHRTVYGNGKLGGRADRQFLPFVRATTAAEAECMLTNQSGGGIRSLHTHFQRNGGIYDDNRKCESI